MSAPALFTTIVADPPWKYADTIRMNDGVKRSAEDQYSVMSLNDICAFGTTVPVCAQGTIAEAAAATAFLWMWVTNPFLVDGSATRVATAWGFRPVQLITWGKGRIASDKVVWRLGMGRYTRGVTEHMMLCVRGAGHTKLLKSRSLPNCFLADRGRHSEKPEAAFQLIEALTPGPYLEVFARVQRPGWTAFGNQL